jgi:tetraacyldisaccharide 4'-kinase
MKVIKALILFPISFIYAFIVNIRNTLFDLKILKSYEFDLPVISVGNITVGGTGKTPTVEYLVSLLKPIYKVAVLSRGYKRKTISWLWSAKVG